MKEIQQIKIPITKSARTFGYIVWRRKTQDGAMRELLGGRTKVEVTWGDSRLGTKSADYHRARLSVGWRQTRALDAKLRYYVLTVTKLGKLVVSFA